MAMSKRFLTQLKCDVEKKNGLFILYKGIQKTMENLSTDKETKFLRHNQAQLIQDLFNNAVIIGDYDVAYELCHYFLEDLIKINYFTSIDYLIEKFR